MDSVEFCGQLCHEVMEPEFAALPGRAALAGQVRRLPHRRGRRLVRQVEVVGHAADLRRHASTRYERPVPDAGAQPAPGTRNLRAVPLARQVPRRQDRRASAEYAEDEANTMTETSLRLHVGGSRAAPAVRDRASTGTRAPNNEIEYVATDDKRQEIPVRPPHRPPHRQVKEFVVEGATPPSWQGGARRRMDCVDCHNRPDHAFCHDGGAGGEHRDGGRATAGRPAVRPTRRRRASARGGVPVAGRGAGGASTGPADSTSRLSRRADAKPTSTGPSRACSGSTAAMSSPPCGSPGARTSTTGATPTPPGCFRCHDDNHKTKDGEVIRQDLRPLPRGGVIGS